MNDRGYCNLNGFTNLSLFIYIFFQNIYTSVFLASFTELHNTEIKILIFNFFLFLRVTCILSGMEISSHQFHLLQQLNEQRRQDLFCDCNILVEGKVFKAHRNVLFASSGYFKMLLSQSSKETTQPTTATFQAFSPDTFTVILDFVYSGKLSLTGQNVIEVMSAASYLQMTDVISVCKTFIKSSLDISEKEKDRYFSLSDKEVNSNGVDRSCLYSAGWRAESSPPHSHLNPDQGTCMMGGNAWSNFNYYPASQRNAQQQLSKHDQRQDSIKKSRHLGLQQPSDIPHYKSSKLEDRAAEPAGHITQSEEQVQIETEVESPHVGYQYGQGSDVISRSLAVSQQEHESPRSSSKSKSSKADEPYASMPSILGVMGGWTEGKFVFMLQSSVNHLVSVRKYTLLKECAFTRNTFPFSRNVSLESKALFFSNYE